MAPRAPALDWERKQYSWEKEVRGWGLFGIYPGFCKGHPKHEMACGCVCVCI